MKRAVKYCLGIVIISAVTAGALPSLDVEVRRHLPDGRELVHASQGAFGPAADGIVMLYREEGCADCRYEGMSLVPGKGGLYRAVPLPAIRQFDNLTVQNDGIGSVLFVDADGDGRNEVLVLVKGLRRGPGGYPLACVAVLGWDGASFRALAAYENYFGESCDSAAQVRAMTGLLAGVRGSYVSETAGVSADMTITLSENGSITGTWNAVYGAAHMCDRLTFTVRQSGGTTELVRWSDGAGAEVVMGTMRVSGKGATVRFIRDPGEFDCGAGHPAVVKLVRAPSGLRPPPP